MSTDAQRYTGYRWVVLGLAWLAMVAVGWVQYLPSSLAYLLVPELSLTPTQMTLIFTAPILTIAFANILGGVLGDRYGIRLMVGTGAVLAGVTTIARFWVAGFSELLLLSGVFGIGVGVAFPNLSKLVAVWFPPKQVGLASGIYMTAFSFGMGVGLATGAYFGGWRESFLYVGILLTVLALLWVVFGRSAPRGVALKMPSPLTGILVAMKSRYVWLLCAAMFLFNGGVIGFMGNLPEALTKIYNISPQVAGVISSVPTFAGIAGCLLLPMLSDRAGLRKPFIYGGVIVAAICFYLAWRLAPGIDTYILIAIGGISSSIAPLLYTMPMELSGIGREYVGGATGLMSALGNLGGFLIPLLVITPVMKAQTTAAYNIGFLVIALLLAVIALVIIPLTETGTRARKQSKR